jgi:hypothetical protein
MEQQLKLISYLRTYLFDEESLSGEDYIDAITVKSCPPRSAKKQYHRLVKILQGYAIVSSGVQLSVINITPVSSITYLEGTLCHTYTERQPTDCPIYTTEPSHRGQYSVHIWS